jgi:hypothetical protein
MNSISKSIKLLLPLALCCTSLLDNHTLVLANPTPTKPSHPLNNRSTGKAVLTQAVTYKKPQVPPGPGPGGRVRGGARRTPEMCPSVTKPDLTALVSFTEESGSVINVWGLTAAERTTWFFYIPYTNKTAYPVQFVLKENQDQDSKTIYKKAIALRDQPGIISVSLPASASPLEVNKQYRWFLTVSCDKENDSPPIFVEGVIQRVNLTQAILQQLEKADPLKRVNIYAEQGIWYEALTTLAELRRQNRQDATLQAQWRNLLTSIGLGDVVTEPILPN